MSDIEILKRSSIIADRLLRSLPSNPKTATQRRALIAAMLEHLSEDGSIEATYPELVATSHRLGRPVSLPFVTREVNTMIAEGQIIRTRPPARNTAPAGRPGPYAPVYVVVAGAAPRVPRQATRKTFNITLDVETYRELFDAAGGHGHVSGWAAQAVREKLAAAKPLLDAAGRRSEIRKDTTREGDGVPGSGVITDYDASAGS